MAVIRRQGEFKSIHARACSGYVRKLGVQHCIFDWGNTLMVDLPEMEGPMCSWSQVFMVEGADRVLAALSAQNTCHLATNAAAGT
jgi:hypothetical protein